jgi:FKBP-type peptidyl-prolyl cis-trans isomerase SlyD
MPVHARCGPAVTELSVQSNAHVTVDYELRNEGGELIDVSEAEGGAPIRYVHGYGMLVPGLEAALTGLSAGDEREIIVPAAAGYGEYDNDLVLEVDRAELDRPQDVQIGDELVAESPDGEEIAMRVVRIRDSGLVVDANHPLAGMTLRYRVWVRAVRAATADEIERAAADLDEAIDHADDPAWGSECGSTPEGSGGPSANV